MYKIHTHTHTPTHIHLVLPRQRVAGFLGKHAAALRKSCTYGRKRGTAADTDM